MENDCENCPAENDVAGHCKACGCNLCKTCITKNDVGGNPWCDLCHQDEFEIK